MIFDNDDDNGDPVQVKPFQCRHDPAACRVAFTTKQCLQVDSLCHQHHRHMGQILQDGENACFTSIFLKVEASCDQT